MNTTTVASSATTGVATGLLGNVIPIVGLTGGLIMQLAERDVPSFARVDRITEGVVDGSAALLCRSLFRGSRARSLARPMAGPAKPRATPIRT